MMAAVPTSLRRELTAEEFKRVDLALSAAYDRMDELSATDRDFVEIHVGRVAKFEGKLWMSDRELRRVAAIARGLNA